MADSEGLCVTYTLKVAHNGLQHFLVSFLVDSTNLIVGEKGLAILWRRRLP